MQHASRTLAGTYVGVRCHTRYVEWPFCSSHTCLVSALYVVACLVRPPVMPRPALRRATPCTASCHALHCVMPRPVLHQLASLRRGFTFCHAAAATASATATVSAAAATTAAAIAFSTRKWHHPQHLPLQRQPPSSTATTVACHRWQLPPNATASSHHHQSSPPTVTIAMPHAPCHCCHQQPSPSPCHTRRVTATR
jgi:hypothetical protein